MPRSSANPRRSILVVLDLQETREALERLLQTAQYEVYGAADEQCAMDRARLHPPDLVLVSLVGSAKAVTEKMIAFRSRAGLDRSTPILILPGSDVPEGSEVDCGEGIVMAVPDNFAQLKTLLKRLLDGAPTTRANGRAQS